MPLSSSGSSEHVSESRSAEAQPAVIPDRLAALSHDEPLPEAYTIDQARLLVQSPYRLFLYWSHARDPFATLHKAFSNGATNYHMAVRLVDTESGEESWHEASPAQEYWFNARPGRTYQAHVGFFAPERPFIRLLSSEIVRTPRAGVSSTTDHTPEFRVPALEFARVLNEAGYARDALGVALEAADEVTRDETTRAITEMLVGNEPPIGDAELAELRSLIAALALGESFERVRATLSPRLARWLDQMIEKQGGGFDTARLLNFLHSILAFEIEYDAAGNLEPAGLAQQVSSFILSADYVHHPAAGHPHIWMPSMTEGLLKQSIIKQPSDI